MVLHGVDCERTEPITHEIYVCAWKDRLKLALGLLSEGKGTRISYRPQIVGVKGILSRPFAVIQVESYADR